MLWEVHTNQLRGVEGGDARGLTDWGKIETCMYVWDNYETFKVPLLFGAELLCVFSYN